MNPYIQEANQQFVSVYNRYPIVLDHGDGMYLYDTEGKKYLDFGSGIGVCGLPGAAFLHKAGHRHEQY